MVDTFLVLLRFSTQIERVDVLMVSAVFGSCNKNVFFLVAGVMLVFRRSATVRSLDSLHLCLEKHVIS